MKDNKGMQTELTVEAFRYVVKERRDNYDAIKFSDYDELFDYVQKDDLILVLTNDINNYQIMSISAKHVIGDTIKTLDLNNISIIGKQYSVTFVNGHITTSTCKEVLVVKRKEEVE